MTDTAYSRMRRYAVLSALHLVVVAAALAGLAGPNAGLVVLATSVPLLLAWGPFHADIAMNPALDDVARTRWRVLVWCLPWSMAAYWHLYIRPRRVFD